MMNIRSWWVEFRYWRIHREKERLAAWIANHVPRWLAYRCAIRVGVEATTGQWSHQIVPELYFFDALKRWDGTGGDAR